MISDLTRMVDQVSREKGVERDVLIKALEEAVRAAARKKYGPDYDLEVSFNDELGEIEVFEFKEVAEEITNKHVQITLDEARKMDPESEFGDSLGIKMDTDAFGRIAAQSAKQVIMQRLKEAERDIVYDDFKDRQREVINGIVQRFDRGSIIVNLGRTEAELPTKEQVPKESYRQGDRIRAYILDVGNTVADRRSSFLGLTPILYLPFLRTRFLKSQKVLFRSCRLQESPAAGPRSRLRQRMLM